MKKISPSLLAADFYNLEKDLKRVSAASYLHYDVMDGSFVSNITFGHQILAQIRSHTNQDLEAHLMVVNPLKQIEKYYNAGASIVIIHYEAVTEQELDNYLLTNTLPFGLSIKPNTDIKVLDKYLDKIDAILIMSVEPGKGGQVFLESAYQKIDYLQRKRLQQTYKYKIMVDGGINDKLALKLFEKGCDILVMGSYLFKQKDPNSVIKLLEL